MAAEMNALAAVGKLPPCDDYLDRLRPKKPRTGAEILATLQEAARRSRGAMTIRKVEE